MLDLTTVEAVEELTVQEVLLAVLDLAEAGLQRGSIDELERLIEWLRFVPWQQWPPEVVEFVRHQFKRVGGKLRFKRPRGRMHSTRLDQWRFCQDPNRIAAVNYIAGRRHHRSGKLKEQLQRAIDEVNAHPAFRARTDPKEKASIEVVRELLRRGRGKRPAGRFDDDPNGY
jgi:hypothetical protein